MRGNLDRLAVTALLLLVSACAGSVQNTSSHYVHAWNDRLAQYERQFVAADAEIRADADRLNTDIQAERIRSWPELMQPVAGITGKVREAYTIAGRGELLRRFIEHIQTNPTAGLTEVWFQNESTDWQQRAERVDRQTRDFLDTLDARLAESPQWMGDSEALAKEQGFVRGTALELPSLYQQAVAYFREVQAAEAADLERRQRVAQSLAAMGAYYNQLNYQQQLLNTLNRPRTCNFFGNSMTCY